MADQSTPTRNTRPAAIQFLFLLANAIARLCYQEFQLRQYEDGKRFCDAVVAQSDVATLHRAWDAPELLPSLAELAEPARWLGRVAQAPA